jgi:hypothetical protein
MQSNNWSLGDLSDFCFQIQGKGLAQLLYDPDAGGMSCDVEMHNPPPTMADKEAVEDLEREGWDGKESIAAITSL